MLQNKGLSQPIPYQILKKAVILSDKLNDNQKAGMLTCQDEGVPPGKKYQNINLQKLFEKRKDNLYMF